MNDEFRAVSFLRNLAGIASTDISVERPTEAKALPRYLLDLYNLRDGTIFGTPVTFATSRVDDRNIRSVDLRRQADLLRRLTQREPVFVFDRIRVETTQRLIDAQVSFIETDRQVFLPFILLRLRTGKKAAASPYAKDLGPWAQVLLTRQLLDQGVSGHSGTEIARELGLTKMTVSRALEELRLANLCSYRQVRRSKLVAFPERDELWSLARRRLKSPVSSIVGIDRIPAKPPMVVSGETALAARSLLAEPKTPTYAIGARSWRSIQSQSQEEPGIWLELWNRDPLATARDGLVDPISLALILEDESDERVQGAVAEMMAAVGLPFKPRSAP